jgi:hypothetical protein
MMQHPLLSNLSENGQVILQVCWSPVPIPVSICSLGKA